MKGKKLQVEVCDYDRSRLGDSAKALSSQTYSRYKYQNMFLNRGATFGEFKLSMVQNRQGNGENTRGNKTIVLVQVTTRNTSFGMQHGISE